MACSAASLVVKRIVWPHDVVYTVAGKSAAYEELLISLFVQGYLIVMKGDLETFMVKMASHVEKLMGDLKLYGWERGACHGVWFNQHEQGWASWENEEEKVRFQHALVWHLATLASSARSTSAVSCAQKQAKLSFAYNGPVRPGMKACNAFNEGSCTNAATYLSQLHICSHCLVMVIRTFPYQEIDCNRKQFPV